MNIRMYELDNKQPDGVDLPDEAPSAYRNQYILENFMHKNKYPVMLDWGNPDMTFLVLIESEKNIVGMCAMIPYKNLSKVHLCIIMVIPRLRRKGLGTEMLKRVVMMHPRATITLSVMFEQANVMGFYLNKGYAKLTSVNTDKRCFVMSLVNLKLLQDVPLPD